ncbi:hypothetical protein ENLAB_32310 [Enterococcus innesii]|uniref:Transporter n=1 Tax=Enterococcus innesii TaxID=2839759 RepID=A0ABM7XX17_9ENTE|nr:hypothetical protein ENLAB_32310 [Enterococcus innesii]
MLFYSPPDYSLKEIVLMWVSGIILFSSLMYVAYTYIINLDSVISLSFNDKTYELAINHLLLLGIVGILLLVYMKFLTSPYAYWIYVPSSIILMISNFYAPQGLIFIISFISIILLFILDIIFLEPYLF